MIFKISLFLSACINTITGTEHSVGEEFLQGCSTRCTCQSGGVADCVAVPCEYSGPTCTAVGDPHYTTFDGRAYDYQGHCQYAHIQRCENSEFSIKTRHSPCPYITATCVREVTIEVPEVTIVLAEGYPVIPVTINGQLWPASNTLYQLGGLEVRRSGSYIIVFLKTIGIKITWNGYTKIQATVSTRLQNKLCGLCGTYNGNQNDDFRRRDGVLTTSITQFGDSWLIENSCPTSGKRNVQETPGCSTDSAVIKEGRERCAVLMGEVFSPCNSVVNPAQFIHNCEFDYACCNGEGQEDCYCDNLATYAATCADAGVTLSAWRKFFCRMLTTL